MKFDLEKTNNNCLYAGAHVRLLFGGTRAPTLHLFGHTTRILRAESLRNGEQLSLLVRDRSHEFVELLSIVRKT